MLIYGGDRNSCSSINTHADKTSDEKNEMSVAEIVTAMARQGGVNDTNTGA